MRFGWLWFGGIGSAEPPNLAKMAEFGRTETEPNSSVAHYRIESTKTKVRLTNLKNEL